MDMLPPKEIRVTVYDSDGGAESERLASWLRDQGYEWARQLQGGWAEWLEFGEPSERPKPVEGAKVQVGEPIVTTSGIQGVVQGIEVSGSVHTYTVLRDDGTVLSCGEEDLAE
jgi:3-mercaptopyruvate sulfurtransferase SseA